MLTTVLPAHPLFLVLLPNLNAALPLLLVLSFPKVSKFFISDFVKFSVKRVYHSK